MAVYKPQHINSSFVRIRQVIKDIIPNKRFSDVLSFDKGIINQNA